MNMGGNAMGFVSALLLAMVAQSLGWGIAVSIGTLFALLAAAFILMVNADEQMDQAN